jgi:ABC-type Fe3+-hydroxamate transport system substrate-binding protein
MSTTFSDQMGQQVTISCPVKRIVSLVPSQTELLADLDLHDEVVGITKFCVHPEGWRKTKAVVGGTKNFSIEAIDALKPDLIIGNKEENEKERIEILQGKYPVWMSDITTLEDSLTMIRSLGEITSKISQAESVIQSIRESFSRLKKVTPASVLYLIWRDPWMAAGTGTFIHMMMGEIGLRNVLEIPRYPQLTRSQVSELRPDYIFLSSEPYPFSQKHIDEVRAMAPASKIMLVDGEMFSWYGSRLIKAPTYFNSLRLP